MKNDKLIDSYIKVINEQAVNAGEFDEKLKSSTMTKREWEALKSSVPEEEFNRILSKYCPICMTNAPCYHKMNDRCTSYETKCPHRFSVGHHF